LWILNAVGTYWCSMVQPYLIRKFCTATCHSFP
jgi:hypothetical protein